MVVFYLIALLQIMYIFWNPTLVSLFAMLAKSANAEEGLIWWFILVVGTVFAMLANAECKCGTGIDLMVGGVANDD